MKTFKLSLLALSLTALAGCKAIDAMDNTETMKTDLAAMKNVTGGMATTTDDMKNTTTELKRVETIKTGIEWMSKPENRQSASVPATNLLIGAKRVAENMTAAELAEFLSRKLKELRKKTPTPIFMDAGFAGGRRAKLKYMYEFNLDKQVDVVVLRSVSGLIPQAVMERIIADQAHGGGGLFKRELYEILMLRAMFINEYKLGEDIFGNKLDTLELVRDAFKFAKQLQFVVDLPDADRVAFKLDADQFLPSVLPAANQECTDDQLNTTPSECQPTLGDAPSYNEKLDRNVAKPWFEKIAKRIDKDLSEELRGGTYARELAEIKAECLRYVDQK